MRAVQSVRTRPAALQLQRLLAVLLLTFGVLPGHTLAQGEPVPYQTLAFHESSRQLVSASSIVHESPQASQQTEAEQARLRSVWAQRLSAFQTQIPPYPEQRFRGKGIVITAGRRMYFTAAYVTISVLRRKVKSELPIEVFYGGEEELPQVAIEHMENEFANVKFVDLSAIPQAQGVDIFGYQMKALAIYFSSFEEVLWLDSDNMPIRSPDNIFESQLYQQHGAVLWPGAGVGQLRERKKERKKERARERERERERARKTDRKTERKKYRQKERKKKREIAITK